MDKFATLLEDLRSTTEYLASGNAPIMFHPLRRSNGNLWAIQGPKKNLVVMLHYQYEPVNTDEVLYIDSVRPTKDAIVRSQTIANPVEEVVANPGESVFENVTNNFAKFQRSKTQLGNEFAVNETANGGLTCVSISEISNEKVDGHVDRCRNDAQVSDNSSQLQEHEKSVNSHSVIENEEMQTGDENHLVIEKVVSEANSKDAQDLTSQCFCHHTEDEDDVVVIYSKRFLGNVTSNLKRSKHVQFEEDIQVNYFERDNFDHNEQPTQKQFYREPSLFQQNVVDNGERLHACLQCGEKFVDKDELTKHEVDHSKEKSYECFECKRKFSRHCALVRHLVTHTEKDRRRKKKK